jgi:hypothetical protein
LCSATIARKDPSTNSYWEGAFSPVLSLMTGRQEADGIRDSSITLWAKILWVIGVALREVGQRDEGDLKLPIKNEVSAYLQMNQSLSEQNSVREPWHWASVNKIPTLLWLYMLFIDTALS